MGARTLRYASKVREEIEAKDLALFESTRDEVVDVIEKAQSENKRLVSIESVVSGELRERINVKLAEFGYEVDECDFGMDGYYNVKW